MTAKPLFKVTFLSGGTVHTLYARRVESGRLWGFVEIAELVFDAHSGLVVDPTEERLCAEFGETQTLHLPMQGVLRIEEVAIARMGPNGATGWDMVPILFPRHLDNNQIVFAFGETIFSA